MCWGGDGFDVVGGELCCCVVGRVGWYLDF